MMVLIMGHNICLYGAIRKIMPVTFFLSGALVNTFKFILCYKQYLIVPAIYGIKLARKPAIAAMHGLVRFSD